MGLSHRASSFGFRWCGWQSGWPKHTVFCSRQDGGELDITLMPQEAAPAMLPRTACLVQASPEARPKAQQDGSDVPLPSVELPCPNQPLAFLRRFVWAKQSRRLTDCLPLPTKLNGAEQRRLSAADVRLLWRLAQDLLARGY